MTATVGQSVHPLPVPADIDGRFSPALTGGVAAVLVALGYPAPGRMDRFDLETALLGFIYDVKGVK
ncbi:hypothetical protein [Kitasatospora purpeofusca]|uniref:hypothetical protein n=1 Tax=Kitasatospora purpeofusca TaxID=67352 RepID=UPI0038707452|nr:hypothetical protein OIP63_31015 [Kitasatospora purpeofusca]